MRGIRYEVYKKYKQLMNRGRIVIIDTESEDSSDNWRIYLRGKKQVIGDYYPYTKSLYLHVIMSQEGKEKIIGEITGHFFDLKHINLEGKADYIIDILNQYDEETFDICQNLCKETACIKGKGQNIFHLDRLYIAPEYRGNGTGRKTLSYFQRKASYLLGEEVRYIALFPDPITDDPYFDSFSDMDIEERDQRVQQLKEFYSSLGFKEMKSQPSYMYLDRYSNFVVNKRRLYQPIANIR